MGHALDVDADILGVIEAENRVALKRFSTLLLKAVGSAIYDHIFVIDGNDERGIDVGVMTRQGYEISELRSHVDDADADGQIFSRDCAEYVIKTPTGARLVLLVNHLKSKGYGKAVESNERRRRQAARIGEIYDGLRAAGEDNVVVVGDLNDTPDSAPLAPLLAQTDLRDVATHPKFTNDGRPGTFKNGTKSQKIDYASRAAELRRFRTNTFEAPSTAACYFRRRRTTYNGDERWRPLPANPWIFA